MSEDKEKNQQTKQEPPELPDKDVIPPDIELVLNVKKLDIEKRVIIKEDDE